MPWHEDGLNQQHIQSLQKSLRDDRARVLIFLGAGLSFGAARAKGRARFDDEEWGRSKKTAPSDSGDGSRIDLAWDDDGNPLPSWPWLVSRMRDQLGMRVAHEHLDSLAKFFHDEGPLDCAQLFRKTVGEGNYRKFLRDQFDVSSRPEVATTPSHNALVALGLPIVFTTNYDELIERAYAEASVEIRVSADEPEFRARLAEHPKHHLVKLHGSIDRPETIVLTREDYSAARFRRRLMFEELQHHMREGTFLFVGFSLSDPNFNVLRDDIRYSMDGNAPVCFTVQGRRDPIKQSYLESLDVNTVWLDTWNDLPRFLRGIAPK